MKLEALKVGGNRWADNASSHRSNIPCSGRLVSLPHGASPCSGWPLIVIIAQRGESNLLCISQELGLRLIDLGCAVVEMPLGSDRSDMRELASALHEVTQAEESVDSKLLGIVHIRSSGIGLHAYNGYSAIEEHSSGHPLSAIDEVKDWLRTKLG